MIRLLALLAFFALAIGSCTPVNSNPDILLKEPYSKVKYIADPDERYSIIEVVQVETRGTYANILNTIPQLYKKALKFSEGSEVKISDIDISAYTKLEQVQVPYQDCRMVSRMVSVPMTSCINGSCSTTYSYQNQLVQECTTQYRTEVLNVLYQVASANIIDLREN